MIHFNSKEFDDIISDIIKNQKFQAMKQELHHGISRYHHSLRVAKCSYYVAKKFRINYSDITRAALMHDFFLNEELANLNSAQGLKKHPYHALNNAKQYFDINKIQENMIISHMYPIGKIRPKYKESWLLTAVDKSVSLYEMYRFKAALVLGIWAIFLFNMITLNNR